MLDCTPLCPCCGLAGGCRNWLHEISGRIKYPGWKQVSSFKGGSTRKWGGHGLTKSSSSHWAAQQEEITKQETSAGSDQLFCSLTSKWSLPGMIFHFLPVSPAYLWESDFTVILGRWTSLFLLLHTPLCCCQTLSPLPAHWSSPKQREWSVRKPRDLSDSASFGLSINWETNVISPPLPIDWACVCRSGIWSWIFQWLGKSLILKRRFVGRCGIKGIGSRYPYNESEERGDSLSNASSLLQTPFKGGQSS